MQCMSAIRQATARSLLYRATRDPSRGQGSINWRDPATHVEDRGQSRRHAGRGLRPVAHRRPRRPITILAGAEPAVLRLQPAWLEELGRCAPVVLVARDDGRAACQLLLHQGILGDGPHRGSEEDRRANAGHAGRRRLDRADRCLGAAFGEDRQGRNAETLPWCSAWDVHYAQGPRKCRFAGLH
jgi:hypothetical protein